MSLLSKHMLKNKMNADKRLHMERGKPSHAGNEQLKQPATASRMRAGPMISPSQLGQSTLEFYTNVWDVGKGRTSFMEQNAVRSSVGQLCAIREDPLEGNEAPLVSTKTRKGHSEDKPISAGRSPAIVRNRAVNFQNEAIRKRQSVSTAKEHTTTCDTPFPRTQPKVATNMNKFERQKQKSNTPLKGTTQTKNQASGPGAKSKVSPKHNTPNKVRATKSRHMRLAETNLMPSPRELYKIAKRKIKAEERATAQAKLEEQKRMQSFTVSNLSKFDDLACNFPINSYQYHFQNSRVDFDEEPLEDETGSMESDFRSGDISSRKLSEFENKSNYSSNDFEGENPIYEGSHEDMSIEDLEVFGPFLSQLNDDPQSLVQHFPSEGSLVQREFSGTEIASPLTTAKRLSLYSRRPAPASSAQTEAATRRRSYTTHNENFDSLPNKRRLQTGLTAKSETNSDEIALPKTIILRQKENSGSSPENTSLTKTQTQTKLSTNTASKTESNSSPGTQSENVIRKLPDFMAYSTRFHKTHYTPVITNSTTENRVSAPRSEETADLREDSKNLESVNKELGPTNITPFNQQSKFLPTIPKEDNLLETQKDKTSGSTRSISAEKILREAASENQNSTEAEEQELRKNSFGRESFKTDQDGENKTPTGDRKTEGSKQIFAKVSETDLEAREFSAAESKGSAESQNALPKEDEKRNTFSPLESIAKLKARVSRLHISNVLWQKPKQSKSNAEVISKNEKSAYSVLSENSTEENVLSAGEGTGRPEEKTRENNLTATAQVRGDSSVDQKEMSRHKMERWKNKVDESLKMSSIPQSAKMYASRTNETDSSKPSEGWKSKIKSASERLSGLGEKMDALRIPNAEAKRSDEESNIVDRWQRMSRNYYKEKMGIVSDVSETESEDESFPVKDSYISSKTKSSDGKSKVKTTKLTAKSSSASKGKSKDTGTKKSKKETPHWIENLRPGLNNMNKEFIEQYRQSLSQTKQSNRLFSKEKQSPLKGRSNASSLSKPNAVKSSGSKASSPSKKTLKLGTITAKLDISSGRHKLSSGATKRLPTDSQDRRNSSSVRVPPPCKPAPTLSKAGTNNRSASTSVAPRGVSSPSPQRTNPMGKTSQKKTPEKQMSESLSRSSPSVLASTTARKLLPRARNQQVKPEAGTSRILQKPKSGKEKVRKVSPPQVNDSSDKSKTKSLSTLTAPLRATVKGVPKTKKKKKKASSANPKVQLFKKQFRLFAKRGDKRYTGNYITLLNSKKWFKQAGLFGPTMKMTTNDVEIHFLYLTGRNRSLPMSEFLKLLQALACEKKIPVQEITERLIECGPPMDGKMDLAIAALLDLPLETAKEQEAPEAPQPSTSTGKTKLKGKKQKLTTSTLKTLIESNAGNFSPI